MDWKQEELTNLHCQLFFVIGCLSSVGIGLVRQYEPVSAPSSVFRFAIFSVYLSPRSLISMPLGSILLFRAGLCCRAYRPAPLLFLYANKKRLTIIDCQPFRCPGQESNLHALRHTHLKRARLPIPPPGHSMIV